MSNLTLSELSALQAKHSNLTLNQVFKFISLAGKLKNNIILVQPSHVSVSKPPEILPQTVSLFLERSCGISRECVQDCWEILQWIVWHGGDSLDLGKEFRSHGHALGLYEKTLYPPQQNCINVDCSRSRTGALPAALKKTEQRQGILYTLDKGPQPTISVQLYCQECNTSYSHNFSVHGNLGQHQTSMRIYYDGIPDIVQVGDHQFAERQLIELWITQMLISWTSATNCARLYNISFADTVLPADWAFGPIVTTEQVWDGFVILALLEDCKRQQKSLQVPHTGDQKDRFKKAIQARNLRFRTQGQPEARHFCNKCIRLYPSGKKVSVVVIDGVTIGHPRCAFHHCKCPLENNRHRFCLEHATEDKICAIIDGSHVCSNSDHRAVEKVARERRQARFQFQERLQRACVAHPNDALAQETNLTELIDVNEDMEDFEVHATKKRLRAQFGCKRTHNEEIIVAPCGIIIARETFYEAEGAGAVVGMIKRTFHEDIRPDHIFFDNNCTIAKMVKGVNCDPFFDNIGLTVDVFHFKCKHSESDIYCQQHCNPAAYNELKSDNGKGWYFNSSIAEQTNVWLGGYHSICREMLVDKYNFFLDEMILRRNQMTKEKLTKQGRAPGNWPYLL